MSRGYLQPATQRDIMRLWPAVRAAHLFSSAAEFEAFWSSAPWRVQVSRAGDAAVLRRWREHLSVLAVSALWCPASHAPRAIRDLRALARDQGYEQLLSPLVSAEVAAGYLQADMHEHERIVTLRVDEHTASSWTSDPIPGVRLRSACASDMKEMLEIDAQCFDDFWRYGPKELGDYFVRDRVVVAENAEGLIGYTLCTVENGAGTLGRLAVRPVDRRRGVGTTLLVDAVKCMMRQGAGIVSLCTQEDNAASRAAYGRVGMRELPGRLYLLMGETQR